MFISLSKCISLRGLFTILIHSDGSAGVAGLLSQGNHCLTMCVHFSRKELPFGGRMHPTTPFINCPICLRSFNYFTSQRLYTIPVLPKLDPGIPGIQDTEFQFDSSLPRVCYLARFPVLKMEYLDTYIKHTCYTVLLLIIWHSLAVRYE